LSFGVNISRISFDLGCVLGFLDPMIIALLLFFFAGNIMVSLWRLICFVRCLGSFVFDLLGPSHVFVAGI
jgi:hypothetical protein